MGECIGRSDHTRRDDYRSHDGGGSGHGVPGSSKRRHLHNNGHLIGSVPQCGEVDLARTDLAVDLRDTRSGLSIRDRGGRRRGERNLALEERDLVRAREFP